MLTTTTYLTVCLDLPMPAIIANSTVLLNLPMPTIRAIRTLLDDAIMRATIATNYNLKLRRQNPLGIFIFQHGRFIYRKQKTERTALERDQPTPPSSIYSLPYKAYSPTATILKRGQLDPTFFYLQPPLKASPYIEETQTPPADTQQSHNEPPKSPNEPPKRPNEPPKRPNDSPKSHNEPPKRPNEPKRPEKHPKWPEEPPKRPEKHPTREEARRGPKRPNEPRTHFSQPHLA